MMADREIVLLLHGMWMGPWAMSWLAHELGKAGFETQYLSLRSMSDAHEAHVESLAEAVAKLDAKRIHLLGHSLGGVIILHYLRGVVDKRVKRALLLGAPALGSDAARQLDQQPWGGVLGASRELWRSDFPSDIKGKVEVGAIAGEHAFGLGVLFATLDGPNDGAVTVAETKIAGLHDHIVLPVGHSAMLLSPDVARQAIAFLKDGAFQR
jgi:pimeloyl-ACP methyl ester carboxylesterase